MQGFFKERISENRIAELAFLKRAKIETFARFSNAYENKGLERS